MLLMAVLYLAHEVMTPEESNISWIVGAVLLLVYAGLVAGNEKYGWTHRIFPRR